MKKIILFDMYGVLMRHANPVVMSELISRSGALKAGKSVKEFQEAWKKLRCPIDAGRITPGQFWARMQTELGIALDGPAYDKHEPAGAGYLDNEMVEYALGLKTENVEVGILSNIPHYMVENLYDKIPILQEFNYRFYSCQMGYAKPELGIYRKTIEELSLPARQILFFDDLEENVAAARQCGLNAQVHRSIDETQKVVAEFLKS
ncbi:HAD-IA family hydrolase [Actinomycetaceae bacterium TAE3-ERU4]|nr:HAD-IA family hydrolase [Actinomycetaceae bacterium TAE3-ERU4]